MAANRPTLLLWASTALILSSPAWGSTVERVVAVVNQEAILLSDVEQFRARMKQPNFASDSLVQLLTSGKPLKDESAIINFMINEKLIDSEIKAQNLQVTIERTDQEIKSLARRNKMSVDQLKGALKSSGMNFSEYQDFIKRSLERRSLFDKEISSKIRITDEDILQHYARTRRGGSPLVYQYTLSHIIFSKKKEGGAAAALNRANTVLQKLKAGAAFATLAKQYSEDPHFSEGGTLGTFSVEELAPDWRNAVSQIEAGKTTEILSSGDSFHIVRVDKKTLVTNPDVEREKPKIRETLESEAFAKQLSAWLDQKRRDASIRINSLEPNS